MSEHQSKVETILSCSDIVWPRYGTETIAQLAARIINAVQNAAPSEFSWNPPIADVVHQPDARDAEAVA